MNKKRILIYSIISVILLGLISSWLLIYYCMPCSWQKINHLDYCLETELAIKYAKNITSSTILINVENEKGGFPPPKDIYFYIDGEKIPRNNIKYSNNDTPEVGEVYAYNLTNQINPVGKNVSISAVFNNETSDFVCPQSFSAIVASA